LVKPEIGNIIEKKGIFLKFLPGCMNRKKINMMWNSGEIKAFSGF